MPRHKERARGAGEPMTALLQGYPSSPYPDAACEDAFFAAWRRARELGLALPPFVLLWVRASGATVLGETEVSTSRFVHVYLRDDLGARGTYDTTLHELQHVADRDLIRAGRMSVDALERRADAFVAYAQIDRRRGGPLLTFEEYVPLFLGGVHDEGAIERRCSDAM